VEGVALDLYPGINMWEASRPTIEKWMLDNLGPAAKIRDFTETALDTLGRLPKILDHLEILANQPPPPARRSRLRIFFYGLFGGIVGSLALYFLYNSFN